MGQGDEETAIEGSLSGSTVEFEFPAENVEIKDDCCMFAIAYSVYGDGDLIRWDTADNCDVSCSSCDGGDTDDTGEEEKDEEEEEDPSAGPEVADALTELLPEHFPSTRWPVSSSQDSTFLLT